MDYTETLVRHINGYNGLIVNTTLDRVVLQNGEHTLREVVDHPGGVTVIPRRRRGLRLLRTPVSLSYGRASSRSSRGQARRG